MLLRLQFHIRLLLLHLNQMIQYVFTIMSYQVKIQNFISLNSFIQKFLKFYLSHANFPFKNYMRLHLILYIYNLKYQMKEEQIEPRVFSTQGKVQEKKETDPIQTQKLQRKSVDKLVNPMNEPSKIKIENQAAFHTAHGQRKAMNIERIKEYMVKRNQSYQERVRICDTLRAMFYEKQKNTKAFLKNIIRYFQDYADIYISLHKSIGKLEIKKKYQNQVTYTAIKQSIGQLVKLNQNESEHVQKFVDWLEKILIQAFKSASNYFKDRVKKLNKDIENSESSYFSSKSKQEKAFEKITQGNDLLQKELILMEHIKNTNEAAIQRAVDIYQAWQYLLEEQNTIKKLLKDNILQFHERFVKFHKKTDSSNSIYKYWMNLPLSPQVLVVFASFLDEKSIQYINFGSKSKKLSDNFQNFMRMIYQEQRVGKLYPFLEILISKKYNSKLQLTEREWKDIKLVFTVDGNLLVYDEKQGKVILKLAQKTIKLKRISENILELAGIEEGLIFNSKKKQSIHFQTLDQVQQFIYYVNSIPETKRQQQAK